MADSELQLFMSGRDRRPMVFVPAGEFLFGPDLEKEIIEAFYIDRFPVTNAEYKVFVEEMEFEHPAHWRRGAWPEGKADHPVVQITWQSANAYAEWAGKRLPAELEWEKAARSRDGRLWPWGNAFDPNRCNTSSSGTSSVGLYSPRGDSPFGCADMAGNVWEWIGGKPSPIRMPLRGGDWLDGPEEAQTVFRRMHTPFRKNDFIGFRLAADTATPFEAGKNG